LGKSPSRSRVLADQAPTSARKTPPDSKTNDTTVFFDSIDPSRTSAANFTVSQNPSLIDVVGWLPA